MGIFRRRPRAEPLPTTGHEGDDTLLALIATTADLDEPREWVHYLYFREEEFARRAGEEVSLAGWTVDRHYRPEPPGDKQWPLVVQRRCAVTPDAVREARRLFESVAAIYGGDYDGWEAAL